jgi:alkylhydroperoxidase family enzyme
MGHQEAKLAAAGLSDGQIAALDGDWSEFDPKERAAFAFAKKLTFEPHAITDADLDALRAHYTEPQILEMIVVNGNFNAMNRWTGALRIPQEEHREYLTATSEPYRDLLSRVAPLAEGSAPSCAPPAVRPALGTRVEARAAIEQARTRTPRLPLVEPAETLAVVPEGYPDREAVARQNWARLLANFPVAGANRMAIRRSAIEDGELAPEWKARIAWAAARNDRAWYALAHAGQWLRDLGWSDDQIFALDDPDRANSSAERAVLNLARKLTVDPARITDADIENLRAEFSDRQTAEVVYHITEAAFFDRLTEAVALPLVADVFDQQ